MHSNVIIHWNTIKMTDPRQVSSSSLSPTARFSVIDGWLDGVKRIDSPNFDERSTASVVDLLVIHCIALPPNQFGGKGIEQLFTNQLDPEDDPYYHEIADLKVSAHVLIRRTGEVIQFVSFNQRAWHAGESNYQGRIACNDFSIGIELEGTDKDAYEVIQYQALATVIASLMTHYPALNVDRIVGHETIAAGRKTDPGQGFDWHFFQSELAVSSGQSRL